MSAKVRWREDRQYWEVLVHHKRQRFKQRCDSESEAWKVADQITARIKAQGVEGFETAQNRKREIVRFGPYANKWLSEMRQSQRKQTTVDRYECCLRVHVKPEFESNALEYLTYRRLKAFCIEKSSKLSRDSVRLIIATLRLILKEALREGIIPNNPASGLGEFYGKATEEEVDPFTKDELGRILAHAKTTGYFEFILTLARTGMRFGEARALRWQDIDFQKGRIRVARNWPANGPMTSPKTTRSRREVDMTPQLVAALKALRSRRKAEYLSRGKTEIPELVFLSPGRKMKGGTRKEGSPIAYANFRHKCWDLLLTKAEVRPRGIHHLRHTYATQMLLSGANVFYVSRQLGHSRNTMTLDTYTHWIQESNAREVDRLDAEIPEVKEK